MSVIEKSIEVDVPLQVAYDQWTQFEDFPQFMSGIEEIRQLSDGRTHWRLSIGGVTREFDADVLVQQPDQGVSWRSVDGPTHAGSVRFEPLDQSRTRVRLSMDYQTEGFVEKVGDAMGIIERQATKDLANFKQFIESRGAATGSWRGEIGSGPGLGPTTVG
ncbi:MAG: SRPBCC family protein [Kineosporiaceae bacterium]